MCGRRRAASAPARGPRPHSLSRSVSRTGPAVYPARRRGISGTDREKRSELEVGAKARAQQARAIVVADRKHVQRESRSTDGPEPHTKAEWRRTQASVTCCYKIGLYENDITVAIRNDSAPPLGNRESYNLREREMLVYTNRIESYLQIGVKRFAYDLRSILMRPNPRAITIDPEFAIPSFQLPGFNRLFL